MTPILWLGLVVAVLLVGAVAFLAGYAIGYRDSMTDTATAAPAGRETPHQEGGANE